MTRRRAEHDEAGAATASPGRLGGRGRPVDRHASVGFPLPSPAHGLACLLVAATAMLLCFGALVTTFDAALAVPDWPATYGHNMLLFPFAEWFFGPWELFLEHGHRLLGAAVGLITLVLTAVVWRSKASPVVRALTAAAVLLVVVQGLLGGARVLLDDKTLAKVHACTGPLFFAVAVAIATLTGRGHDVPMSRCDDGPPSPRAIAARVGSAALVIASYFQLVAGAQLRHVDAGVDPVTFRWLVGAHVVGGCAVAAIAGMLAWTNAAVASPARRWSWLVATLVVGQVFLGCGAWVVTWGLPADLLPEAWQSSQVVVARSLTGATVVTAHVVLGMLILGSAVVLWIVCGGLGSGGAAGRGIRPSRAGGAFA